MITSLLLLSSLALQLPVPPDANVLQEPANVTKRSVLAACATNTFVAQQIERDLHATVGYAPGKDGPLVLVLQAASPPLLDAAHDVARSLRSSIEGCLSHIDVVPQAVRDADEAARVKWFDEAIARLFVIRASDRKLHGLQRDYAFQGEKLVLLAPKK